MSKDIVDRLRARQKSHDEHWLKDPISIEAADEIERLREALLPFAGYMAQEGGRMDCDNLGDPLPNDLGVGWIYLTHGDFRRAEAAINTLAKEADQ